MERSTVTGTKPANDGDDEDSRGRAACVKRRHGKTGATESSTPGSDTFAAIGPPKTPEKATRSSQSANQQASPASAPSSPVHNIMKNEPAGDEPRLLTELTPKSVWSDQAMDLLLREWTESCNFRLLWWVDKHCGLEMAATATAVATECDLTEEKARGIRAILTKSRMPTRAFTNLLAVQLK